MRRDRRRRSGCDPHVGTGGERRSDPRPRQCRSRPLRRPRSAAASLRGNRHSRWARHDAASPRPRQAPSAAAARTRPAVQRQACRRARCQHPPASRCLACGKSPRPSPSFSLSRGSPNVRRAPPKRSRPTRPTKRPSRHYSTSPTSPRDQRPSTCGAAARHDPRGALADCAPSCGGRRPDATCCSTCATNVALRFAGDTVMALRLAEAQLVRDRDRGHADRRRLVTRLVANSRPGRRSASRSRFAVVRTVVAARCRNGSAREHGCH
jgi:hypothetical protein